MKQTRRIAAVAALTLTLALESGARPLAFEDLLGLYDDVVVQLQEDLLSAIAAEPELEPAFATVPQAFPAIREHLRIVRKWMRNSRGTNAVEMADKLAFESGLTSAVEQYLSATRGDTVTLPGKVRLVGRGAQLLLSLAHFLEPLVPILGTKVETLGVLCRLTGGEVQDGAGASGTEEEIKRDLSRIEGKLDQLLKPKLVFVTRALFDGNLTDETVPGCDFFETDPLKRADEICSCFARLAGLGTRFDAWLSTSNPLVNARSRVSQGGWSTTCKGAQTVVANNLGDLISGAIRSPINCDEAGLPVQQRPLRFSGVWTGTTSAGTVATATCSDWTSNAAGSGIVGTTGNQNSKNSSWTDTGSGGIGDCGVDRSLYCFER